MLRLRKQLIEFQKERATIVLKIQQKKVDKDFLRHDAYNELRAIDENITQTNTLL